MCSNIAQTYAEFIPLLRQMQSLFHCLYNLRYGVNTIFVKLNSSICKDEYQHSSTYRNVASLCLCLMPEQNVLLCI